MTVLKTLLTDGHDLRALTGVNVLRMDLFAPGLLRGSNDIIPARRGQVGAPLVIDAYQFAVTVEVFGATEAAKITNLRNLYAAVAGTSGLVALERRLPNVGGTYDASTAAGQFAGLTDLVDTEGGLQTQLSVQFLNLDGAWNDGTNWIVP